MGMCTDRTWMCFARRGLFRRRAAAVAEAKWPPVAISIEMRPPAITTLNTSAAVNQSLEAARQQKTIGSALAASVHLTASGRDADLLERYRDELPMFFITSSVEVTRASEGGLTVEVSRAAGEKCPRCWRYVTDITTEGELPGICGRCVDAMGGQLVAGR